MNICIKVRLKGHDRIETFSKEQGNNIARNVLARIRGTDPQLKHQYVIMGAHLDHVGMRMRNGLIYNGKAKQTLYVSLINKGWKAEEIGSAYTRRRPGSGSGIAGGNLNVLR